MEYLQENSSSTAISATSTFHIMGQNGEIGGSTIGAALIQANLDLLLFISLFSTVLQFSSIVYLES